MQTVVETPTYLRSVQVLLTEAEQFDLVADIATDPEAGDLMQGTGGFRKRRFGRAGTGKRGGVRVVYFYGGPDYPVFLIAVYSKTAKSNLSKAEQNALAKIRKAFLEDYRGTR